MWQLDFNVTCYEGRHATLVWALGIPGIVLFATGWPVLVGLLLSGLQPYLLCGRRVRLVEDMTGEQGPTPEHPSSKDPAPGGQASPLR